MKAVIAALIIAVSISSSIYLGECFSEPLAPALYVFGDSLVDSGNNNWLNVAFYAKANNYKPYGFDFPGSIATGRVTNGKNVPDLIADFLGLPYPTRVKQPNQNVSLTGYNYASAGCGILPETGPLNCLNLTEQVRLFERTKNSELIKALDYDEEKLEVHLANSIFFIWVGNNDYLLNYFSAATNTSKDYTPEEFSTLLIQGLSQKIESLYRLGARKIVIFEGPPFGCLPFYYAQNQACVENKNANATMFNAKLKDMITILSSQLSNSYFTIGKAYDLTYDAIKNPTNYGLTNVTGPCCELGKFLGQTLVQCKSLGTKCEKRDEYMFWDAAHHTQDAYAILGEQCINNSTVCTPYSIRDLVQVTINNPSSLLSVA